MDKWDTLENKVTEKKGSSKKVVVLCVVLGVVIACGGFFGLMFLVEPIIDDYLHDTKQIYRLYDFYDLDVGSTGTAVYFIGSSVVGDAVHCQKIDQHLQNAGYNISTYNLLMDSDTPLRRVSQIQSIVESHPSLVIIGVTYRSVTDELWVDETVSLVQNRLKINPDAYYLYSPEELEDISHPLNLRDKIRFLKSALLPYSEEWGYDGLSYAKDPFAINQHDRRADNVSIDVLIEQANDPADKWRPEVSSEMTRHKEALIYNVKTLEDAGIPVILLNMPLHPLFSEKVTDESRQNFFDLLNQTGARWYDMEYSYDFSYFRDSHHASLEGGEIFSKDISNLIISEVKSGAVHYA